MYKRQAVTGGSYTGGIPGESVVVYTFSSGAPGKAPGQPELLSPGNGAGGAGTAQAFAWTPVDGGRNYRLTVSPNADLSAPVIDTYTVSYTHLDVYKRQVYETMEERGILDMKRRIIDFHTHLGDIFHDSRNIVFHPQLHFPPYPDPCEDLARDHYSRALVTENQEEQNILIDAGQLRTWEYGSLEATQKALDENHKMCIRDRCDPVEGIIGCKQQLIFAKQSGQFPHRCV